MQSQPTEEEDSAKDSTPDTTDDEDPDWDTIGYILASDHRSSVLDVLSRGPETPTGISDASDLSVTHVSRTLSGLRERGLVELLVPEDRRKGRIYGLTETGRDVSAQVSEVGA